MKGVRDMRFQLGEHVPDTESAIWIAETASVVGQVRLAERTSVFYGAVLRGDSGAITVGTGSNLQDGCVVHADPGLDVVIGESVTVGHGAIIHGCTIGDDVLVGMGWRPESGVNRPAEVLASVSDATRWR